MKTKKSFILYIDSLNILSDLSDEQAGRLFKMIREYIIGNTYVTSDQLLKIAFVPIKNYIDRDRENWENILERNRINGKKGGRPTKVVETQNNPKNPVGYLETQNNPEKPRETQANPKNLDSDNDNDNDSDSDNDNDSDSDNDNDSDSDSDNEIVISKDIEQSSETIKTTKSKEPTPNEDKRDTRIDELIAYIKEKTGLESLDGTIKQNRFRAKNLFDRLKKEYEKYNELDLAKQLVDLAMADEFMSTNLTSVTYLFYNYNKIIMKSKAKQAKNTVYTV